MDLGLVAGALTLLSSTCFPSTLESLVDSRCFLQFN